MIRGWRAYSLSAAVEGQPRLVRGMWKAWPTTEMTAECLIWHNADFLYYDIDSEPHPDDADDRRTLCRTHLNETDPQMHGGHGCGIYVVPELADLDIVTDGFGYIEAAVIGWGITAVYEATVKGRDPIESYRVERARIEYMRIRPPLAGTAQAPALAVALSEHYGIPVELAS